MRTTLIEALIVLAACLAVCFFAMATIEGSLYEMEDIGMQALESADAGDLEEAQVQMQHLAANWTKDRPVLEILVSHEDLHTVTEQYVEASTNLERGHLDDYYKSMSLLLEALKHIREQEALGWSNLF